MLRYSKKLHCLIKYMLESNPLLRPDIYQVSSLAFQLANKQCPIQNLNNSIVPDWSELDSPLNETDSKLIKNKQQQAAAQQRQQQSQNQQFVEGTSVVPRSRPKASSSNLVVNQQQSILPPVPSSINNRSPTPLNETLQQQQTTTQPTFPTSTTSNSSRNSISSITEQDSIATTITKIASLTNLNQTTSAPTSTIVTPSLDYCKYTFGDSQLDQQSKNPFTTQTFSNDNLAKQFNEKLGSLGQQQQIHHRRMASDASFLNSKYNYAQSNSINDSVNLQTSCTSLSGLSGSQLDKAQWMNPFDDSFSNEQAIDHWFDELGKRDEDKRKYF